LILHFFRHATRLEAGEFDRLKARLEGGEIPRRLKQELGERIVAFYHGGTAAARASQDFDRQFRDREIPEDIPECVILRKDFPAPSVNLAELLVYCGLTATRGEAKRLLAQGGVRLNGGKLKPGDLELPLDQPVILQAGKRNFRRVRREANP
jgi:tyrosyl-tRNA synthetase